MGGVVPEPHDGLLGLFSNSGVASSFTSDMGLDARIDLLSSDFAWVNADTAIDAGLDCFRRCLSRLGNGILAKPPVQRAIQPFQQRFCRSHLGGFFIILISSTQLGRWVAHCTVSMHT